MAAVNFTPISLYYSTTAAAVPSSGNLVAGELALNTVDEKLYFKNSGGTVKLLASNASTGATVSSVAMSVPAFLSVAGSPITSSGTLAVTLSGTALPVANGGTGQTTAGAAFNALSPITTTGDLILGNGTNSATRLAIGANGYVLTSNGTTASWAATSGGVSTFSAGTTGLTPNTATTGAVTLAGTLGTANGGTNLTSFTSGGVVYASSSSALATGSALSFTGTNLGIGTTTPSSTLQVNKASANPTITATRTGNSATTIGDALYLRLNDSFGSSGMRTEIGMGYGIPGTQTYTPAVIGYVQVIGTGNSYGDIYFATRDVTTDTAPVERMRISASGVISDSAGNLRAIPQSGSSKTTSYTLTTTDIGQYILLGASGAVVIPDATFATGDVVSIFNNTASTATITCSITTAYIAGTFTDKATMTLAAAGVATILFITGTTCVVSGNVT